MKVFKLANYICARILTMNVYSLCVANGFTVAGGFVLALVHDKLVMGSNPNFRCFFPETKMGIAIPQAAL